LRFVRAGDDQIVVTITVRITGDGPSPETNAQIDRETGIVIREGFKSAKWRCEQKQGGGQLHE
jgi:hypothetical protein